jgi:hypothetical protein
MKPFLAALVLALGVARSAAISPVPESYNGYWRETEYYVFVDSSEHLAAVKWNPETSDAPLSIKAAIAAARASLKKMVGPAHEHFECDEVRLREVSGTKKWVYVVQFISYDESQLSKDGAIAMLPFIVYLDGFVQFPEKRLKAPEPTPTAVTPRAP